MGGTSSRSPGEQQEQAAFSNRLREVIGAESVRSFASRTGVSDTTLRKYLAGTSDPGRATLVGLARAGKVSLLWLATGEGPRYRVESGAIDVTLLGGIEWRSAAIEAARLSAEPGALALLVAYFRASVAQQEPPSLQQPIGERRKPGRRRPIPTLGDIQRRTQMGTMLLAQTYNQLIEEDEEQRWRLLDNRMLGQAQALLSERERQRESSDDT